MKEVAKNIFYVGVQDKDLRVFDIVMYTQYGTSYNAYLVRGEKKTALFETCKAPFFDRQLESIKEICDPKSIDYLIMQHTEPDHSGSVEYLLNICPNLTVVGSVGAVTFLKEILNRDFKSITVKEGDSIELGGKTLEFMPLPFLHWPDTMFTYLPEEKTLFTCDSFGCHYADERIFNDETKDFTGFHDAYKYYFDNIIGPYKHPFMDNALKKIEKFEIKHICNGHGPVIRKEPEKYIEMYKEWCALPKPAVKSAAVAYCSAYGYTASLAQKIAEALSAKGISAQVFDMVKDDFKTVADAFKKADGVLFGSCTILGDSLPPINDLINTFNPTIDKGKLAGAFGSFGWSGEAVGNIEARLALMKMSVPVQGYKARLKPSALELQGAYAFGEAFAEALLK